jgi:putative salt-induced outer membrane protein YdiY
MKIGIITRRAVLTLAAAMALTITPSVQADDAAVPAAPKSPWASSAALGLTMTRGNSDTALFTLQVNAARKKDDTELALGADVAYGENSGVKNTETYHAFSQLNYLFSDRMYAYGRVDGLRDTIAALDYRFSFSPGVGYYFVKTTNTFLSGEVGPGAVYEKQGGKTQTYVTLRVAEKFEHKINDHVKIWQGVEVLPQVDRWKNYIINSEIGVEAGLTTKASLRVYLQDTYDNEPAAGRKANDLKLVAALAYKF